MVISYDTKSTPRPHFISQLFFSWLNPIFQKGFSTNVLEVNDLHELENENKAEYETKRLDEHWQEETMEHNYKSPGYEPSIGRAVWRCYRRSLLHSGFYTTIESASRIAQALLIGLLVTGLAEGTNGEHGARLQFYVPALCVITYLFVITLHRGQYLGKLYGMRLRIAVTGLVYKKVFKLTQSSVAFFTTGHVINLVSNDVRKFDNFFRSFHYLWLAPLELLITTYLVWRMIGWLAIIASVYMLLFIPILAFIGKQLGKLHLKVSALTDRRVRLTGEILSGIRAIKMHTWEIPMSNMVGKLRRLELKKIRWLSVLQAGIVIIYFLTMVLLSLVLYTSLVAEGHLLTAQNVFTTMVLYGNIKHSLCGHFGLQMSYTLQGLASLKRIQRFLAYEEKIVPMSFDNPAFSVLNYIFAQKEVQDVVPDSGYHGTFRRLYSRKLRPDCTNTFADDTIADDNSSCNELDVSDENSIVITIDESSDETDNNGSNDNNCNENDGNKVNTTYSNNNNNATDIGIKKQDTAFLHVQDATCYWNGKSTQPCLSNINFSLSSGALLAVTGPIGSGKSSLLMSILGEMRPALGKIKQQGRVAYASQSPWVFTGTVRENILFGLPYDHSRYQEIIAACQLTDDFKTFPNGDATFIGERGISLSGGQRARVSLARAVYYNADIYLLDDPFSALDIQIGKKLFDECIKGLLKNHLVILVTHHLSYLREADRILLMKDGNMVAEGSYEEIQNAGIDVFSIHQTFSVTPRLPRKSSTQSQVTTDEPRKKLKRSLSVGIERVEEKRITGSVPLSLYWRYFRAGNSTISLTIVCLLLIASQVTLKLSEWWLACWTDLPYKEQQNNLNIYVFAGLIGLYMVLSFTGGIMHFQNYLNSNGRLHDNMVKSVVRAPALFFDTNPTGRIQNRFSKDLGLMDQELPSVGFKFFFSLINCMGSVLLVAAVQYWAVIAAIPLVIVFVILGMYYVRTTREVKRLEARSRSPVYSHLSETLQGLTSIQCFKAEERFTQNFYSFQDEHTRAWLTYIAGGEWLGVRAELLTATFLAAASVAAVTTSADAGFTGLALYSAVSLTQIIYLAVHNSVQFEGLMTSVERVLEYGQLASEQGYQVEAQSPTQWPQEGTISCEDLSLVYYEGGPRTLKNITFTVKSKEKVGIVGQTGSGKSSLLAALFQMPEAQGKVIIDGVDISTINLQSSRANMSVIPQDPFLFGGELRTNLDPFLTADETTLWHALERVQLKEKVQALPGKLHYELSESGSNLSVGERQLVCLARALIQQNKIIIIDEATANVDFETDRKIQETIRQNFSECAVLTIAHRLDTIMDSDRVMVLSEGSVIEYDSPAVLLEREGSMFAQLVEQQ